MRRRRFLYHSAALASMTSTQAAHGMPWVPLVLSEVIIGFVSRTVAAGVGRALVRPVISSIIRREAPKTLQQRTSNYIASSTTRKDTKSDVIWSKRAEQILEKIFEKRLEADVERILKSAFNEGTEVVSTFDERNPISGKGTFVTADGICSIPIEHIAALQATAMTLIQMRDLDIAAVSTLLYPISELGPIFSTRNTSLPGAHYRTPAGQVQITTFTKDGALFGDVTMFDDLHRSMRSLAGVPCPLAWISD